MELLGLVVIMLLYIIILYFINKNKATELVKDLMRYAQIRKTDIANGEGIRVSLYVQGCHRHCFNCFNQAIKIIFINT